MNGSVPLTGDWQFFPELLMPPRLGQEVKGQLLKVPGTWNQVIPEKGHGYGTYVLRVKLAEHDTRLAIRLMTVSTAYRLYANNMLLAQGGIIGSGNAEYEPGYNTGVFVLPTTIENDVVLYLQVANYNYYKGGLWEPVWIGSYDQLRRERESGLWLTALLSGAFFLIGLYHFLIWILRREDKASGWFAIMAISLGLRLMTIDEAYLGVIFPSIPWHILLRLEYATMLVSFSAIIFFIRTLYPKEFPGKFYLPINIFAIGYAFLVCILPVDTFSRGLSLIQLVLVYASLISPVSLYLAIRRKREGALLLMLGAIAICSSSLHDILISVDKGKTLFSIYGSRVYLQPYGHLIFVICQAALLSIRSSRTLHNLKQTTDELNNAQLSLNEYAHNLEQKVEQRTQELQIVNRELERLSNTDTLTGLWNRRYFEEQYEKLNLVQTRQNAYIAVLMVDIDFFKGINDLYGHLKGDEILVTISNLVKSCLNRPLDLVARYGGEEIVVILPGTDLAGARKVADEICRRVYELNIPHEMSIFGRVTVSVGVSSEVAGKTTSKALLAQADLALYSAKDAGRNTVKSAL